MNAGALLSRPGGLARRAWQVVLARGPRLQHPATGCLLACMILGGIWLRIQNVGYPLHSCFDEFQYVGSAHEFLVGLPDVGECCHPPLSKLLLGVGMLLFGYNTIGWRFVPLCLGIQCIVLVYLIARSLFQDRRAGWLAAAFMAADGFFISYSRAALPDGLLACIVLWSLLAAVTARSWVGVLVSAVLVGAAASIKWVGLMAALPACFAILMHRRVPWYTLAWFAVVPVVHAGVWAIGLGLSERPNDIVSIVNVIIERKNMHLAFPHSTNPLESSWYTWLVLYHPIMSKISQVGSELRVASTVGNPLLWLMADLCLLGLPVVGVGLLVRRRWREQWNRWFDADFSKALAILGVAWLCMMMLWMSGRIVTYWYHYLTPWGLALMLVAGVVARADRRYPVAVLTFVILVLAVFVYMAPVWGEIPISASAAHRRLPFSTWW